MRGIKAVRHRIKEGSEYRGSRSFELAPEIGFRTSPFFPNWSQAQKNRPVRQIRPTDEILDPV
jgi:hypothetical protein